ncbi:MAG: DUF2807 domain-containing protein [Bacteroidales bacterium]|nr:MAG: DUF2807 domain-containing protein [Bacteroidales bacterium]
MKCTGLMIILIFAFCFFGCEKEKRTPRIVIGTGEVVTETISVSSFHSLRILGIELLTIKTGDNQEVKLSAQQNIIDAIERNVNDGILILDLSKVTVTTTKPVSVEIIHPDLTKVTLEGIGNFELDGEHRPEIDLEFAGTGNLDAYYLYLSVCNFILSGSGNCEIRVDSILNVFLSGIGNVTYYGDPELTTTITGTGNVVDGG